jgi:hypothetical protein
MNNPLYIKSVGSVFFKILIVYCLFHIFNVLVLGKTGQAIPRVLYIVTLCMLGLAFIHLVSTKKYSILNSLNLKLLVLLFFLVGISLYCQALFMQQLTDYHGKGALEYTVRRTVISVIWFCFGYFVKDTYLQKHNVVAVIITAFTFLIFFYAADFSYFINYSLYSDSADRLAKVSHLTTGTHLALLLFTLYALTKDKYKILILPAFLCILFLAGGRSALFFTIVTLILYELLWGSKRLFFLYSVFLAILSVYILFMIEIVDNYFLQMLLIHGISEDSSTNSRLNQLAIGLRGLPEQLYFGNPSIIIRDLGSMGAYIHNFISAWQFYGVLVFIVITFLLIRIIKYLSHAYFMKKQQNSNSFEEFKILIFVYTIISILLTKVIFFQLLWFSLGLLLKKSGNYKSPTEDGLGFVYTVQRFSRAQR